MARVPVSKTGGWGFESLLPCMCGPVQAATAQASERYSEPASECGLRPVRAADGGGARMAAFAGLDDANA